MSSGKESESRRTGFLKQCSFRIIIKQDDYHTLFEQTRFIKRKNKHEECLHLNADE